MYSWSLVRGRRWRTHSGCRSMRRPPGRSRQVKGGAEIGFATDELLAAPTCPKTAAGQQTGSRPSRSTPSVRPSAPNFSTYTSRLSELLSWLAGRTTTYPRRRADGVARRKHMKKLYFRRPPRQRVKLLAGEGDCFQPVGEGERPEA